MKKIFTLALLALGLTLATPASAQKLSFGLKAGMNVSDLHLSHLDENFDESNRAGWFAGPTVKLSLPVVGLSLDAAALYDYKSSKIKSEDGTSESTTLKQQSIDIPINLRYGVGLGSQASLFLFAGPQWSFNVGDKDFSWKTITSSSTYSLRSTNFSVNVGLGATLLKHLQLTVNYNIACGKTADLTVWDATKTAVKNTTKGRNNSWQIGLAYYF